METQSLQILRIHSSDVPRQTTRSPDDRVTESPESTVPSGQLMGKYEDATLSDVEDEDQPRYMHPGATSSATGTGTNTSQGVTTVNSSCDTSMARARRMRGVHSLVDHLRDTVEAFEFDDLWTPIPRGVSLVMSQLAELKQSVIEVIRVTSVEVALPSDIATEQAFFVITVGCQRQNWCTRKRNNVMGKFFLDAIPSLDGLLRTGPIICDCRTPRLSRRRGTVTVRIQLMSNKSKTSLDARRGSKRGVQLALFEASVPGFAGTSEVSLQAALISSNREFLTSLRSGGFGGGGGEEAPVQAMTSIRNSWDTSRSRQSLGVSPKATAWVRLAVLNHAVMFKASRCKPTVLMRGGYNEWHPATARQWQQLWASPWKDEHVHNASAVARVMIHEMRSNIILMYQTLFSQNTRHAPELPPIDTAAHQAHDRRVLFLKRLILCFAVAGLTFDTLINGTTSRAWPFPLAAALCHGNRVLIRLDGVHWLEFLNFLLLGDAGAHDWQSSVPFPLRARWAATHSIGLAPGTGQLLERRLKKRQVVQNLTDGLTSHHLGMDLPVGGLGNRAPETKHGHLFIGPAGVPYRKTSGSAEGEGFEYVEEIQHGHMYLRWDDFGRQEVPVLIQGQEQEPGGISSSVLEWFQLPSMHSVEDLEHTLREYGNVEAASNPAAIMRLFRQVVQENELMLQGNEQGQLRCRGVLIHFVLTHEEDGETKVLVHQAASAAVDIEAGHLEASTRASQSTFGDDVVQVPLRITLVSARGLRAADYNGKSDPYCICQVQGRPKASFRTRVIKKTLEPVWMHDHHIQDYIVGEALEFSVWDRDYHSRDDLLGKAMLSGPDLYPNGFEGEVALMDAGKGGEQAKLRIKVEVLNSRRVGTESNGLGARSNADTEQDSYCSSVSLANGVGAMYSKRHDGTSSGCRVEDWRVPTLLRRRHEPWSEAISRYLQVQHNLSPANTQRVIGLCKEAETDSVIYSCEPSPTTCHHHCATEKLLPIEYQAFRFKVCIDRKNKDIFAQLLQKEFQTQEHSVQLEGFGGDHPACEGTVTREWTWMKEDEALARNIDGLIPPNDRLRIVKESGNLSALLVGIEGSAPYKETFFGATHSVKAKVNDVSAFGSKKWREYRKGGQEVPADLGGMHCVVDEFVFEDLVNLCNKLDLVKPSDGHQKGERQRFEKQLFRDLLSCAGEDARAILRRKLDFTRSAFDSQTGTFVFDSYVRERVSTPRSSSGGTRTSSGEGGRGGLLKSDSTLTSRPSNKTTNSNETSPGNTELPIIKEIISI